MGFLDTVLKSFLGDKNAKDLKEIKKVVDKIKKVEPAIGQLSDDELRGKTLEFKKKIAAATEDITKEINETKELVKNTTNVIYLSTIDSTLKVTGHLNGYGSEYITERQMRKEVDFETIEIEKW